MSENREDQAMLDRALAQMAQETPEMPADFHNSWTSAVRAEAAKEQEINELPAAAGSKNDFAVEITAAQPARRRQWRYILSAAAVFVFLIGGTLLTRSTNKDIRSDNMAGGVPVTVVEQTLTPEILAMNSTISVQEEAAPEADPEPAAEEKAAKYSMDMDAGAFMEEAEVPNEFFEEAAGAALEETADAQAMTAADTAEETAELFFDEAVEEPAEKGQEEAAGEPAQESEFVSFLKDLGIFTLKTLIVAAAAAALAFGAAAVHKAWKRRKST